MAGGAVFRICSAFPADLAAALGTCDDDLALAPGHAAHRAALGAGEVLVLLIHPLLLISGGAALDGPPHLLQKAGVLCPPLLQAPGEHAVHGDDQQHRGQKADDQMHCLLFDEHVGHIQEQGRPDSGQAQLICAVASVHKARQCVADSLQKIHTEVRPPALVSFQSAILQENSAKVKGFYVKFTEWTNFRRGHRVLANSPPAVV